MRNVLASLYLAATVLAAAPALAEEGSTPFGPEDVKRELVGKIWSVELPNGVPAEETFREDGTVKITGGLSDRGYWRMWEQGYCTQWYRMRKGAERCFTLDRTADGKIRVFKPDGEISMTILSTKPIE
jgi:hypothetical protein